MDILDLDLPALPRLRSEPSLPPIPPTRVAGRKRPFIPTTSTTKVDDDDLAAAFNTSSDPAVFSSEDTPDLDNYSGSKRRKKKVYSGTWWSRLRSRAKLNANATDKDGIPRQFRRNFDSGIFMGDESGSSSGMEFSSDPSDDFQLPPALSRDTTRSNGLESLDDVNTHVTRVKSSLHRRGFRRAQSGIVVDKSASDIQVERVIQKCLDTGAEDVDLTDLQLKSLPSTLTDLNTLIRQNSEFTYSALSSRLRLYLGNNSFTQLPLPILELRRITLLSLRQNQLKAIPPGIRKLRKLAELNISSNAIEYLPFEVIELFDRGGLQFFAHDPNPWTPIISREYQLRDVPIVQINSTFHSLTRVAVESATEYGPTGNIIYPSRRLSRQELSKTNNTSSTASSPHLTELILRTLNRENEPANAISSLYHDALSSNVHSLLSRLHDCQSGDAKGQQCTFCHTDVVLPRSRWLEWWSVVGAPADEKIFGYGADESQGGEGGKRRKYRVLDRQPREKAEEEVGGADGAQEQDAARGTVRHNDPVLPFLRVACGCMSQREGLQKEAVRFREG